MENELEETEWVQVDKPGGNCNSQGEKWWFRMVQQKLERRHIEGWGCAGKINLLLAWVW